MHIKANMLERIARVKAPGDEVLVRMLEDRLE